MLLGLCLLSVRRRCCQRRLCLGEGKMVNKEDQRVAKYSSNGRDQILSAIRLFFFSCNGIRLSVVYTPRTLQFSTSPFFIIIQTTFTLQIDWISSHLHMRASACCLWTCVLWLASCCCWWASVCFISTILILCSIAYFLAFVTVSLCSLFNLGNVPPNMPNTDERVPGPKTTSLICLML